MAYKMLMPNGETALWLTSAELARLRAMASTNEASVGGWFHGMRVYVLPEPVPVAPLTGWRRVVAWLVARWKA